MYLSAVSTKQNPTFFKCKISHLTHVHAHITAVEEAGQMCRGRGGRLRVICVPMREQKKNDEKWSFIRAGHHLG